MGKDVIVACDFSSAEATFAFLDKFTGRKPFVKIGMELYYAEGPSIVRELKARGHKIFLDLKLHDIPNTVKKSMAVLSKLDVDITNLHAAGTTAMMRAALEGLTRPDGTRPLLIAVTQLTSTDQEAMERDLLIHEPIDQVVMHYAETAKNAGLDGVVCSPLEAQKVHDRCGRNFLTVTPGVRFADGDVGDQKRVMTPAAAKAIGSDYIVVGRPITAAADPVAAYERCVAEFGRPMAAPTINDSGGCLMESYKREFIQFLEKAGVLRFGDFTAKSGRKIPYFINAGMIKTGEEIATLGEFYARAYKEKLGNQKAVLYGPAYKGISIAVSAAVALSKDGLNVPFFFNRKEAKDHGEGGVFVGYVPQAGEQVVIVEDVITAGTAIRESMAILSQLEGVKVAATFIMVDRKERGKGEKLAMQEVEEEFGFPVYSVVDVYDIIEYLKEDPKNAENVERIQNYLAVNGAKA